MTAPAPVAYSREEAAKACGLSLDSIRRAVNSGALRAKRAGRRILIREEDLRAWLRELPDA